ncbi:MAG: hypothetical protein AAGA64_02235 [Bacteroidota bacterium]
MWNASKNSIPEYQIRDEHLKALENAVADCYEDFDVRSTSVYEALDYLESNSTASWGFTIFREGLEDWNPKALHQGLRLIKQHLGV